MLNVLRESFHEKPWLRIVLGAVGLIMVLSLGSYFVSSPGGGSANWAARVNGKEIPFQEFTERARLVDNRYQEMLGEAYQQFRQPQRIAQEAIEWLVRDELIRQDAQRLGLRPSKRELADLIVSNPQFQDDGGAFIGKTRYLEMVGGERGATRYERQLADALLAQRWYDLVGQASLVDDAALEQSWREQHESTRVDFVLVPSAEQKTDEHVAEEELHGWYDDHAESYRREESRRVRLIVVERARLEGQVEIADQEIRDYYAANQERYSHPEQRRARHILFRVPPDSAEPAKEPLRARAEQARARVAGGEDFAALARELSEDTSSAERDGDLGFFARSDMVTPFSDAAFTTAVGELAPVTESPFGFHVIQVTGSREQGVTPLEEVREEIRRDLVVQRSQERLVEEAQRVRDAVGDDPARLEQVAQAEGLEVHSRTIEGRQRLADLGTTPQFTVAVSQLGAGSVSQPLSTAGGMAIVAVDEVLPPAVPPFEEVREAVRDDVRAGRQRNAAVREGQRALNQHVDFASAAAALGGEVRDSGKLRPGQGLQGVDAPAGELSERLFGDHVLIGQRGVIEIPSGALVYEISEREPFDIAAFEKDKPELRRQLLAERRVAYGQAVLTQMRDSQEIEVNARLIDLQ